MHVYETALRIDIMECILWATLAGGLWNDKGMHHFIMNGRLYGVYLI
jgi:hypothetical protein